MTNMAEDIMHNQDSITPVAITLTDEAQTVVEIESNREDQRQNLVDTVYSTDAWLSLSSYKPQTDISYENRNKKVCSKTSEPQAADLLP